MKGFLIIVFPVIFLIAIIVLFIFLKAKCKPHCSGAFCGPNSSDGCGDICVCSKYGKCQANGACCYPNCNGLACGSDGCGGTCQCNRLPNGVCQAGKCCYKQDCNTVYCGPDGCGGNCTCQQGAICSQAGICSNSGVSGWTYNILASKGTATTNVNSPQECAGWMPENVTLNLLNFPCKNSGDCPQSDPCIDGFCDRNDVYQYWIYDPSSTSGYNCTKLLQGSNVCGIPKPGASAFDIMGNVGPDVAKCSDQCAINPVCPPSGNGACCPQNWTSMGRSAEQNRQSMGQKNSAECIDQNGIVKCCLSSPDVNNYTDCINSGYPSCEKVPNAWWKANLAEINSGVCGMTVSGPGVHVNQQTLQNQAFIQPCQNKYAGDSCNYNDNISSFTGVCKSCLDGQTRCFPDSMCVSTYIAANQPGSCMSQNICG